MKTLTSPSQSCPAAVKRLQVGTEKCRGRKYWFRIRIENKYFKRKQLIIQKIINVNKIKHFKLINNDQGSEYLFI